MVQLGRSYILRTAPFRWGWCLYKGSKRDVFYSLPLSCEDTAWDGSYKPAQRPQLTPIMLAPWTQSSQATSVAEASLCCEPQLALLCSRSLRETEYNEQNNECAQAWSAEPRHFIDERPSPGHAHKDFLIWQPICGEASEDLRKI